MNNIPTASHLLTLARETAYQSMTDVNDSACASGFVSCDDGGDVFVKVEIVALDEIVTVGPIFYAEEIHREIYVIENAREAVETLAAALSFRRYDVEF